MATPRSPYVCIGDSLLDEPWPREVKTTLVMLSCHMHTRWRSDRRLTLEDVANSHPVCKTDAMKITGKGRADVAWKSLRCLADFASMSIELRREVGVDVAWISWPKWAEYNQSLTRQRGNSGLPESPSSSASASASGKEEKKKSEAAPRLALEEFQPFTEKHPKLINLLSSQDGDPAEKLAWLNDEGPVIEAEVEAGTGSWKVLTIRYYRRYLQGSRKHQNATRDAKVAKAVREAEEADRAAAHAI